MRKDAKQIRSPIVFVAFVVVSIERHGTLAYRSKEVMPFSGTAKIEKFYDPRQVRSFFCLSTKRKKSKHKVKWPLR